MGQKVHPGGLRVGVIHDWKSNWYTGKKDFAKYIGEDVKIREHILRKLSHAGLSDILIRKDKQRITVDIFTARPGIVIGKSGVEVDALRKELHAITQKNVHININEIKRPELDANELVILQAYADEGPTLKRWRARARGRVNRIRKRTCHITVTLVEAPAGAAPAVEEAAPAEVAEAPKPKRAAAKKKEAAK